MATLPATVYYWRPQGGDDSSWTLDADGTFAPTAGDTVEVKKVAPSKSAFIVADTTIVAGSISDVNAGYGDSITVNGAAGFSAGTNRVYSLDSGPSWLSINPSTGDITGTAPGEDEAETVVLRATNSKYTATVSFDMNVTSGMPAFAYEAEAQDVFDRSAALGDSLSDLRKWTMNRLVKKLKNIGVWDDMTLFYVPQNATSATSKINWVNPGTHDLVSHGSPVFTSDNGWYGANNTTDYLDTGYAINLIPQNSHTLGVMIKNQGSNAGNHSGQFGALDGSNNGFGVSSHDGGAGYMLGWSSSGEVSVGVSSETQYTGFAAISRSSSTTFSGMFNGSFRTVPTTASTPISSTNTLTVCKVNGKSGTSRYVQCAFLASRGFTETELKAMYAAILEYTEAVSYGEFISESVGIGTENISADIVVYGTCPSAITAAYEASRNGKSVAIVGGWRDRRVGGMSTGGLGRTDVDNQACLGGLGRWVITQINADYARTDDRFDFEPYKFTRVMHRLLDPTRNGGYTIPVYYTNGVYAVTKTGTVLDSIQTVDGRTVSASQWIDASYEGDLLYAAGVTMTKGREAAGSGAESVNGFRGIVATDGGDGAQFKRSTTLINVDPYLTPGDSGSGMLPGLSGRTYGVDTPTVGSADDEIQAYNFRLILTSNAVYKIPFPSTPPTGYTSAEFEALGRYFAAAPTCSWTDIWLTVISLNVNTYDFNNWGGLSSDVLGLSKSYPAASYEDREVIWKQHWDRILRLWYYLQYDSDSRIPSAIRTEALKWGPHALHYPDHHENDSPFDTPQLYVRECWRMVSDTVWNGNDLIATDGTTPRSIKTIGVASYAMDSHHTEALVDPNGGTPRIWNSGGMGKVSGGTDEMCPLPYDIIVPKAADCTNILSTFAVSATHVAFGAIRMEITAMQIGQSAGLAASLAIDEDVDVQDVDYPTLRTALLASPSLSGEVAPVLPQVN